MGKEPTVAPPVTETPRTGKHRDNAQLGAVCSSQRLGGLPGRGGRGVSGPGQPWPGHSHAEEPSLEAEGTVFERETGWEAGSEGRGEARSLLASCSQPPSTAAGHREQAMEEGAGVLLPTAEL